MPRTVLINAAPHDAQIILTRIAQRTSEEQISLLVSDSCGLFDFFSSTLAGLTNVSVMAIPATSGVRLSKPAEWFRFRKTLNTIMRKLNLSRGDTLWYIGDFCTLMTAGIISQAARRGAQIVDADHPQYTIEKLSPKWLDFAHLILARIAFGIPLRVVSIGTGNRHYFLNAEKLKAIRRPGDISKDLLQPFLHKPHGKAATHSRNLLLFESASGAKVYINYEKQIREAISRFSQLGYHIFIKPHPRLGKSDFLDDIPEVTIVPQTVPGELMDYSDYSLAVAVYSVAVIHTASLGIPSFCLEHLFTRFNTAGTESDMTRLLGNADLPQNAPLYIPKTPDEFFSAVSHS